MVGLLIQYQLTSKLNFYTPEGRPSTKQSAGKEQKSSGRRHIYLNSIMFFNDLEFVIIYIFYLFIQRYLEQRVNFTQCAVHSLVFKPRPNIS